RTTGFSCLIVRHEPALNHDGSIVAIENCSAELGEKLLRGVYLRLEVRWRVVIVRENARASTGVRSLIVVYNHHAAIVVDHAHVDATLGHLHVHVSERERRSRINGKTWSGANGYTRAILCTYFHFALGNRRKRCICLDEG